MKSLLLAVLLLPACSTVAKFNEALDKLAAGAATGQAVLVEVKGAVETIKAQSAAFDKDGDGAISWREMLLGITGTLLAGAGALWRQRNRESEKRGELWSEVSNLRDTVAKLQVSVPSSSR